MTARNWKRVQKKESALRCCHGQLHINLELDCGDELFASPVHSLLQSKQISWIRYLTVEFMDREKLDSMDRNLNVVLNLFDEQFSQFRIPMSLLYRFKGNIGSDIFNVP